MDEHLVVASAAEVDEAGVSQVFWILGDHAWLVIDYEKANWLVRELRLRLEEAGYVGEK